VLWIGIGIVAALVLAVLVWRRSEADRARTAPPSPDQGLVAPARPLPANRRKPAPSSPDAEFADEDTVVASRAALSAQLRAPEDADGPAVELSEGEESDPTMPFALILVSAIGRTDRGLRRALNEDSYLSVPERFLYVIADGMGGHAAGEVASQLAVDTLATAFEHDAFDGTPDASRPRRGDELVRAIEMANTAIHAQARTNEAQSGMGTTVIAARFTPNKRRVYIAHVGDSRCYRVREGEIVQLTCDHTLGATLGIKGRSAGKLTRAVGVEPTVQVDLQVDAPEPQDLYVLCSDGLSRMVPDEVIRDIVLAERDIEQACQKLIDAANERGGKDNITVIVIRIAEPAELRK
jgi:protein phosphatase